MRRWTALPDAMILPYPKALSLGSNNDINVLDNSSLFDDLLDDIAYVALFVVKGVGFKKGYYLADIIYPQWATFVKSFSVANDEKHSFFKRRQESARKDVKRAFGVLQGRWGNNTTTGTSIPCQQDTQNHIDIDDEIGRVWEAEKPGEVIEMEGGREFPMYYSKWQSIDLASKAHIMPWLTQHFDLTPHMRSDRWTDIQQDIEQHIAKVYTHNKSCLKSKYWSVKPDEERDEAAIRSRPPWNVEKSQ
ncbi:ALP1-like protein [Tanacetum coccineum]